MGFFLSDETRTKADFGTFPLSAGELETKGPRKGVYRNLCYSKSRRPSPVTYWWDARFARVGDF